MEDSTSNKGTFCSRNNKEEEEIYSILEQRRGWETSILGRDVKESSSNEEDEICLKASYKAYTILGVNSSYAQLFRMSGKLVEGNNKLRECISGIMKSKDILKK